MGRCGKVRSATERDEKRDRASVRSSMSTGITHTAGLNSLAALASYPHLATSSSRHVHYAQQPAQSTCGGRSEATSLSDNRHLPASAHVRLMLMCVERSCSTTNTQVQMPMLGSTKARLTSCPGPCKCNGLGHPPRHPSSSLALPPQLLFLLGLDLRVDLGALGRLVAVHFGLHDTVSPRAPVVPPGRRRLTGSVGSFFASFVSSSSGLSLRRSSLARRLAMERWSSA